MSTARQEQLQNLPKVDRLLDSERAAGLIGAYSRARVVEAVRAQVDALRERILADGGDSEFVEAAFFDAVELALAHGAARNLRRVVNATGIVLHTNLGRAPLADAAIEAVAEVARGYSNLEYELDAGKRGSRHDHVAEILCKLTGAEAAVVVNNNAAAVMLAVNTLAKDGEVVTSRGELIEIGGSFRIPDVIEQSEAELVEVGTTNKTHTRDYAEAISNATRMLLKVHPSNYKIVGFTSAPSREELVALGAERGIAVVEDLGSGTLVDLQRFGLAHETTVQEAVAAGVDVVTFSGDKLLGGPQAGIAVGGRECIARMKRNPIMRALRPDKMTIAALEATLLLYLDEDRLVEALPIFRMLSQSDEELKSKAEGLRDDLAGIEGIRAEVKEGESFAGGGSLPDEAIGTWLVAVSADGKSVNQLADGLRKYDPPIIGRISDDALNFDVRTLVEGDAEAIVGAVRQGLA